MSRPAETRWTQLIVAGILGGLMALSLHPGSRPFLLMGFGGVVKPLRALSPLPDPTDPVTSTLWFERAALSEKPPTVDETLLLFEIAEAAVRNEPANRTWDVRQAWCQKRLGNHALARASLGAANNKRADDDHLDEATSWHLSHSGEGPSAWRRAGLVASWPWRPSADEPNSLRAVVAAALPSALLIVGASLGVLSTLARLLDRWGRLPRLADSAWFYPLVGVVSLAVFAATRLVGTSVWTAAVLAGFGSFRERLISHRPQTPTGGSVPTGLFLLAGALVATGAVGASIPSQVLSAYSRQVSSVSGSSAGFIQAGSLVASLSLALSLVRAYRERTEPVFLALGDLQRGAGRAAVYFAALALAATPSCMAWDRSLDSRVAESHRSGR